MSRTLILSLALASKEIPSKSWANFTNVVTAAHGDKIATNYATIYIHLTLTEKQWKKEKLFVYMSDVPSDLRILVRSYEYGKTQRRRKR